LGSPRFTGHIRKVNFVKGPLTGWRRKIDSIIVIVSDSGGHRADTVGVTVPVNVKPNTHKAVARGVEGRRIIEKRSLIVGITARPHIPRNTDRVGATRRGARQMSSRGRRSSGRDRNGPNTSPQIGVCAARKVVDQGYRAVIRGRGNRGGIGEGWGGPSHDASGCRRQM